MDEMLRKIIEQQPRDGYVHVQKNLTDVDVVLKKGNLPKVKPGMYWYTDDTVSQEFRPEKELKSVVLFIKDDIVYGDSFQQRYMLGINTNSFCQKIQGQQPRVAVYYPKADDLQSVQMSLDKINRACKRAQKPRWSEEVYLAESVQEQKLSWVDMFDGGQGQMPNQSGAYFRPMIAFKAK